MVNINSIGSAYCDFVFGSSADAMVNSIVNSYKTRHAFNYGTLESIYNGTKQGFVASYNHTKQNGGFFTSMWKNLQDIPKEWSSIKLTKSNIFEGLYKKSFRALKPLGKAVPALFAIYGFAKEFPNIIRATKEEGLIQGGKEFLKTMLKLTFGAFCGGLGTRLMPVVGSTYGFFLGNMIGDQVGSFLGSNAGEYLSSKATGGTYSEKQKKLEKLKLKEYERKYKQTELMLTEYCKSRNIKLSDEQIKEICSKKIELYG